ncbi:MAG: hypothetical protein LW876_14280 [Betaproteobacteria bacterium]|jgi:hypothetical protein|nr:hypothetical protein [Betaproteobacteria bacterium]
MANHNRATLRNFFRAGRMPTEENFADLIDSTLNMVDEGYAKTPENGVEITSLGATNALASFYTQRDPRTVQWSISYGRDTAAGDRKQLMFAARAAHAAGATVMTLDPLGRVGVGTQSPRHALDVDGVVCSTGRLGAYTPAMSPGGENPEETGYEASPVLADGKPHDITGWLRGCHAFEVMAGVGDRGKGRYSLLHAIALNTYNPSPSLLDWFRPRKRIRVTTAFFGNRCDKLELRWDGTSGKDARYRLMLRTRCPYGEGVRIQYHVTRLWFDPAMDGALPPES